MDRQMLHFAKSTYTNYIIVKKYRNYVKMAHYESLLRGI